MSNSKELDSIVNFVDNIDSENKHSVAGFLYWIEFKAYDVLVLINE